MKQLTSLQEQTLEKYVLGELTPNGRVSFRAEMAAYPEIIEMLDAHDQSEHFLKNDSWPSTSNSDDIKEVLKDFQSSEVQYFSKNLRNVMNEPTSIKRSGSKRLIWMSTGIAATVMILISLNIFLNKSPQQLYNSNSNWEDLPSLVVKSETPENQLQQLEKDFKNKNYNKVVQVTDQMLEEESLSSYILLYRGVSFLELNETSNAQEVFQILVDSDLVDYHMGYWYLALSHLQSGNTDAATKVLDQIISNTEYYNYDKAIVLRSKLD